MIAEVVFLHQRSDLSLASENELHDAGVTDLWNDRFETKEQFWNNFLDI